VSDNRETQNLSNGFLPRAPLLHPEPTAVGLYDLESTDQIRYPQAPPPGARDQLLAVRLHSDPVALIHWDQPPGQAFCAELIDAVWAAGAPEIRGHIARCGCLPAVNDAEQLAAALRGQTDICPCSRVAAPSGSAAVIVCTIGREQPLVRLLESLIGMRGVEFETVLVDNRPSLPGTRAVVERYASRMNIRYVAEPEVGLSAARNAGILAATASLLAFVDDDVVADEQWLARLLEPFDDDAVQAATGLVLPLSLASPVQKRFEQYAGFGRGVSPMLYDMGEHRADDRFLYPYFGGVFGSGNSMAFRRSALLEIGCFERAFGAGTPTGGAEDMVALTDIVLAGGRVAYQPAAIAWHEHRDDQASLEVQVRNYGIALSATLWHYLRRDAGFLRTLVASIPITVGILAKRRHHRGDSVVPVELLRLESRARWLGPWRYTLSRRRAHAGSGTTERRSWRRCVGGDPCDVDVTRDGAGRGSAAQ
jgi:GT2 family glycosyltransferase